MSYIGKTERNLKTRLSEYLDLLTSAISKHLTDSEYAKYILNIDNLFDNVNDCIFHETDTPHSYCHLIQNTKYYILLNLYIHNSRCTFSPNRNCFELDVKHFNNWLAPIERLHMTSQPPCWCSNSKIQNNFYSKIQNNFLIRLFCLEHQHDRHGFCWVGPWGTSASWSLGNALYRENSS